MTAEEFDGLWFMWAKLQEPEVEFAEMIYNQDDPIQSYLEYNVLFRVYELNFMMFNAYMIDRYKVWKAARNE